MQRGFEEGVDADNLTLEINSSRHAYAATPQQVSECFQLAPSSLYNVYSKVIRGVGGCASGLKK